MYLLVWEDGASYDLVIECADVCICSPFSFILPMPCFPMISYLRVLSYATLAIRSPIKMLMSLRGSVSIIDCNAA